MSDKKDNGGDAPDPLAEIEERLRHLYVAPGSTGGIPTERVLLNIKVAKPQNTWFFRTHPDPAYQRKVAVLGDPKDDQLYIVNTELVGGSVDPSLVRMKILRAAINRQNVPFIWPVPAPHDDGTTYPVWENLQSAANLAEEAWVNLSWDRESRLHTIKKAISEGLSPPLWPDEERYPFDKWLALAFKDNLIEAHDHLLLRQLRGEF